MKYFLPVAFIFLLGCSKKDSTTKPAETAPTVAIVKSEKQLQPSCSCYTYKLTFSTTATDPSSVSEIDFVKNSTGASIESDPHWVTPGAYSLPFVNPGIYHFTIYMADGRVLVQPTFELPE